jgi:hypothetical protein
MKNIHNRKVIISSLVGIAFLVAIVDVSISYILVGALVGVSFGFLIVDFFGIKKINFFNKSK